MGCVYKEVALIYEKGNVIPKIKLSNDTVKIVNPDYKKLYRAYSKSTGYALADIMCRKNEETNERELTIVSTIDPLKKNTITDFELVELQKPIFKNGKLVYEDPDIFTKQKYCNDQMKTLYPEVKREKMPHEYYVDGTEEYVNFKNNMISEHRSLVKKM